MILREMKDAGVTHCIMEVSSHSLAQKRIDGCRFAVRVFTNLSPEHLDFHHTMEEYFNVKARLFTDTALEAEGGVSVVNVDDEWGEALTARLEDPLSYSIVSDRRRSRIYPGDFSLSAQGIEARVNIPAETVEVRSPLVGEYNLYNIMAAVAVGFAAGIEAPLISRGINALKSVPGRLEMVTETATRPGPGRFKAYVDYAHTPDALERVLSALRAVREGRIITVFGCGGDRDREKRPLMGEVSVRLSDVTIVTSDNPRDEDPLDIIKEIEAGIKGVKGVKGVKRYDPEMAIEEKGYTVIPERADAITRAVSLARPGDTLLIAGKGHEDCQIVKGKRLRFDDREVLKEVIAHAEAGGQGAGLK
jgi:UDP-N-acetylmuramoyl-L-alanyl-D-glutamate--2,6-diaminopimelate ligase